MSQRSSRQQDLPSAYEEALQKGTLTQQGSIAFYIGGAAPNFSFFTFDNPNLKAAKFWVGQTAGKYSLLYVKYTWGHTKPGGYGHETEYRTIQAKDMFSEADVSLRQKLGDYEAQQIFPVAGGRLWTFYESLAQDIQQAEAKLQLQMKTVGAGQLRRSSISSNHSASNNRPPMNRQGGSGGSIAKLGQISA